MTSDRELECIERLVWQFGCQSMCGEDRVISTCGLGALEDAFDVLGWEDPHIVTGGGCDWPGCNDWTCCGLPTPDGYKRLCSRHYEEMARIIQETEDRT